MPKDQARPDGGEILELKEKENGALRFRLERVSKIAERELLADDCQRGLVEIVNLISHPLGGEGEYSTPEDTQIINELDDENVALKKENERLKETKAFLLKEYGFLTERLTVINNAVQPLWGELRERCDGYQTIEQFLDQQEARNG